ncbi:hypothetical protein [uncultured Microbacterium sp.]|uniref:hypothetical protein n=1 Tax=uncultured Microbacterium sp. TaxID=191216 RepID=UPI0028D37ACD|nr:hypothetical protein [uncultured Microbacterium sp.]
MSAAHPAPLFDGRPLTDPVDPRAVGAFNAELRSRGSTGLQASSIIALAVIAIVTVIAIPIVVSTAISILNSPGSSGFAGLVLLVFLGIGVAVAAAAVVSWRRSRVTRYRLDAFARANGMSYEARVSDPRLPGMVFGLGHSRVATDLVRGDRPRFVEFGNFQYTTGSGKNATTHRWGYVAVKLDVPLPNIVLDAKGNNGFGSNLPAAFQREQRLSLEGDFDRYFTLYCPTGYEQDALYLFTPDIMARFIDNAAELDVEIVDDWLFLYTQRRVTTLDPANWAWLFGTVGALLTKFEQWARWRDDRLLAERSTAAATGSGSTASPAASGPLPFAAPAGMLAPPPGVAHEGRRLKRSGRWLPLVLAVGFMIFWIWSRSV